MKSMLRLDGHSSIKKLIPQSTGYLEYKIYKKYTE
jgi:hypothetical protein